MAFKVVGRVQGVGFRYFTQRAAIQLGIRGWVKNMPDGSVLCHAAGDAAQMEAFRVQLRKGPTFGKVTQLEETPLSEDQGRFHDFQVTY